jgi:hypothetical protein
MPVIPALRRLWQKDRKFKPSLGYIVKPYLNKKKQNWAPVAHACNPSYSGGRDQGLRPALAILRPYLENTQHKKGLAEWLRW